MPRDDDLFDRPDQLQRSDAFETLMMSLPAGRAGSKCAELAQCARREVQIRKRVYPNRVMTRRMSQANAEKEIAMMEQIAQMLEAMAYQQEEQR